MPIKTYELDVSGKNPANKIKDEYHNISPADPLVFGEFNFIALRKAPFFEFTAADEDIVITHTPTNRVLKKGVDYNFGWKHMDLSLALSTNLYGVVVFTDWTLTGEIHISEYQTVGDSYVRQEDDLLEYLANISLNPVSTSWESLVGVPDQVPVLPHDIPFETLKGTDDLIFSIDELAKTIDTLQAYGLTLKNNLKAELTGPDPKSDLDTMTKLGARFNILSATLDSVNVNGIAYLHQTLRLNDPMVSSLKSGILGGWYGWRPQPIAVNGKPLCAIATQGSSGKHYVFVISTTGLTRITVAAGSEFVTEFHEYSGFTKATSITAGANGVYWINPDNQTLYNCEIENPANITKPATLYELVNYEKTVYLGGELTPAIKMTDGKYYRLSQTGTWTRIGTDTYKLLAASNDGKLLTINDSNVINYDGVDKGTAPTAAKFYGIWYHSNGTVRGYIASQSDIESPTFEFYDLTGQLITSTRANILGKTTQMYYLGPMLVWHGDVTNTTPVASYNGNMIQRYTHAMSYDNGQTWYPVESVETNQKNGIVPIINQNNTPLVIGYVYESSIGLSYRKLDA